MCPGRRAPARDGQLIMAAVGACRNRSADRDGRQSDDRAYGCPRGLLTNIPTGGASGKICFSSDIENANYKVVKK